MGNPKFVKTLRYALEWEEKEEEGRLGWSHYDVHTSRKDVDKLVFEEIARVSYHSAKAINFRLMNKEAVKKALESFEIFMQQEQRSAEEAVEVPPADLFGDR